MTDDEILSKLEAIPTAQIAKQSVVVYRCPRGCTLLCVLVIEDRRFGYKPAAKVSPDVNEANSVPAAREKSTFDGDRRWRPYPFPMSLAGGLLLAECDHVRARVDCDTVDADLRAATHRPHTIKLSHNEVR